MLHCTDGFLDTVFIYFINIITYHKCVRCVYLCMTGFRKRINLSLILWIQDLYYQINI